MNTKTTETIIYGVLIGFVLTLASYVVADQFDWIELSEVNFLEAFAVFTSYLCTWLCVRQTRWNYPVGVVTTLAYSILFWQYELFALSLFNMYLVGSLIFGWFRWGPDGTSKPVSTVDGFWWLGYVALALGIYILLFTFNSFFGYEMSWMDIILAIASGVAQFLLDNKKIETWVLWALINIGSIWLYFNTELYIVAFQYVFFLLNAFYGFWLWKNSMVAKGNNDLTTATESGLVFPNHPVSPIKKATFS